MERVFVSGGRYSKENSLIYTLKRCADSTLASATADEAVGTTMSAEIAGCVKLVELNLDPKDGVCNRAFKTIAFYKRFGLNNAVPKELEVYYVRHELKISRTSGSKIGTLSGGLE